jgi:hypothetical protein
MPLRREALDRRPRTSEALERRLRRSEAPKRRGGGEGQSDRSVEQKGIRGARRVGRKE